jgi:hypothetical protein
MMKLISIFWKLEIAILYLILLVNFSFAQEKNWTRYPYSGKADSNRFIESRGEKFAALNFAKANFIGCHFNTIANFAGARFLNIADFSVAKFDSSANFIWSHFQSRPGSPRGPRLNLCRARVKMFSRSVAFFGNRCFCV